tara:strand:+ start:55281 stop:56114 length:834 start_codon:yes stop_codon:yes gene_type:complete
MLSLQEFGISVICPTYNSSEYIQETINSILNQIHLPEEVIFSDDGSTDSTVELIESNRSRFKSKSIQFVVLSGKHNGPGAARNNGLAKATHSWIAFLDADDLWKKEKLLIVRKEIEKNHYNNCFLHWEEYVRINNDRVELKHGLNIYNPKSGLFNQLYKSNFLSTSAIVCKKDLINISGGFDASLPNAQDYDLWLKMSSEIQLAIIPQILGEYIEKSDCITSRPYYKRIWSELRIAFRYRKNVKLLLFLNKVIRIILSKQWFYTFLNIFTNVKKHSN